MQIHLQRERPESWPERRATIRRAWTVPFVCIEYGTEWVAYALNRWTFIEVLEYLGSFGVLIAVIFYFAESGDRLKQKHYQAWQVINSAQGKGGNGGRMEALEELNMDSVPLVGVDLSNAFLQGVHLKKANLIRSRFDAADARDAQFPFARIEDASLRSTNLRAANLQHSSLQRSILDEADLTGADLANADLTGASLEDTDLHNANLANLKWGSLQSVKGANLYNVQNAPNGFLSWALAHGAITKPEQP
jgi:Pentapeptide repeats (8 copies)